MSTLCEITFSWCVPAAVVVGASVVEDFESIDGIFDPCPMD